MLFMDRIAFACDASPMAPCQQASDAQSVTAKLPRLNERGSHALLNVPYFVSY